MKRATPTATLLGPWPRRRELRHTRAFPASRAARQQRLERDDELLLGRPFERLLNSQRGMSDAAPPHALPRPRCQRSWRRWPRDGAPPACPVLTPLSCALASDLSCSFSYMSASSICARPPSRAHLARRVVETHAGRRAQWPPSGANSPEGERLCGAALQPAERPKEATSRCVPSLCLSRGGREWRGDFESRRIAFCAAQLPPRISITTCSLKSENILLVAHAEWMEVMAVV